MTTPPPDAGTDRPTHPASNASPASSDTHDPVLVEPSAENWVREAIAEQEEHIKRWRSCMDTLGRAHTYTVTHLNTEGDAGSPSAGSPSTGASYRACATCGVTQTREDYRICRGGTGSL